MCAFKAEIIVVSGVFMICFSVGFFIKVEAAQFIESFNYSYILPVGITSIFLRVRIKLDQKNLSLCYFKSL